MNGPLKIEIFGVPNWEDLYRRADLDDGGIMTGPTMEMKILQNFIHKQKQPALSISSGSSAGQPQCRPCSTQHDCSSNGIYRCVANAKASTDNRLRQGCCRLDTWSRAQSRQLLRVPSEAAVESSGTAGSVLSDHHCACNCTYVSQACCGADDGIVSEPVSLQVGVLAPPNSTACCNGDTGRFGEGTAQPNSTFC